MRQNVQVNTVTLSDTITTMLPPSWYSSQRPNQNGDQLQNANTRVEAEYYINPAEIVSTTPIVTPDGYLIYKVVVNLTPTESAFQWMTCDLAYALPNGGTQFNYGGKFTSIARTLARK